jgi:hypothetical protein
LFFDATKSIHQRRSRRRAHISQIAGQHPKQKKPHAPEDAWGPIYVWVWYMRHRRYLLAAKTSQEQVVALTW